LRFAIDAASAHPVIHVAGELDLATIDLFQQTIDQVHAPGGDTLILEMSRLTYCSAAGARALHQSYSRLRERGVRLELHHLHSIVRQVLELSPPRDRWWDPRGRASSEVVPAYSVQLGGVMDATMHASDASMGTAHYYRHIDDSLRLVAHKGLDPRFTSFFQIVSGEGSSCAIAAAGLRPVFIEDVLSSSAPSPDLDMLLEAGVRSSASLPILAHRHGLLGVVSAHRPHPGPWSPAQREMLERVRGYAAEMLQV